MTPLLLVALVASPRPAAGVQEADWDVVVEGLRGPILAVRATSAEGTVNLVASIGEDGILLSDTGVDDYVEALAEALARHADGRLDIRRIINTHFHGDHTGGNAALGGDALIISHAATAASLAEGDRFGPGVLATRALPSLLVHDSVTLRFNGENIRVVHVPRAHTDGDLAVHFLDSDVLHVGDIVLAPGSLPYTRFPESYPDAVETLASRVGTNTVVVTGHGESVDREDLVRLARIVRETRAYIARTKAAGASLEEALARRPGEWDEWNSRYLTVDDWLTRLYEREP